MPFTKKAFAFFFILLLFCSSTFLYAQKIGTFQHTYGLSKSEIFGSSVVSLPDKGFLIAGKASNNGTSGYKILIIRTDSLGRQIWSKTYTGAGTGNNSSGQVANTYIYTGVDMVLSPEGNVIVCSNTFNMTAIFLFKINMGGSVLWSKTFPGSNKSVSTLGLCVINAREGGYLLTGASTAISLRGQAFVIKTDTAGNIEWSKVYYHIGFQGSGLMITPSRDGDYLISGVTEDTTKGNSLSFEYPGNFLIMKIDKNGKLLWSKTYSNNPGSSIQFEAASSIIELPDKSIYVCGQGNYTKNAFNATIIKMDSTGNPLWNKTYYSSAILNTEFGSIYYDSVKKTINVSCDFAFSSTGVEACGFIRLDTTGTVILSKIYGPSSQIKIYIHRAIGHNFLHLPSGSFVLIQSDFTSSNGYSYFLVKADSGANSNNCNTSVFSISPFVYPIKYLYGYKDTSVTLKTGNGCTMANVTLTDSLFCNPFICNFGWKNPCSNEKTQFLDSSYSGATNWEWDFGDSSSTSSSSAGSYTSSLKNPTHIYTKAGTYTVKLVSGNGQVKDSLTKTITIYQSPVRVKYFDTLICGGSIIKLHTSGGATYLWKPGGYTTDTTPKLFLKKTTTFIVEAIAANACITNDTAHVTVDYKPGPPVIQNATVKSYKEIDISFIKSDSNDVKSYVIYRSDNGGAYKEIDTIANLSNAKKTYLFADTIVKADSNNYTYKIVAVDSCSGGLDTSTSHRPVLLKGNAGERQSILNWNTYNGYAFDTAIVQRLDTISRKWSNLAYVSNIDSVYIDSSYLKCNKPVYYRIETLLKNKQVSFSDSLMLTSYETTFKDTPQIISVSKISTSKTNGAVLVKWQNNNIHVFYNQLYYSGDGKAFKLLKDSLPVGQDSFIHTVVNTQGADQYYYVVGVDSCPAKSPPSVIHKTITLTVSIGQLLHKLNWTPYQGFKVEKYNIEKLVGTSFVVIDSVPGSDTSSRYFPAPCNHVERYRIEAVGYNPGEISFSDSMGRKAIDTIAPDAPILQNATVINDTSARLDFKGSDSLATYKFVIQRSINGNWGTLGTVLFTHPGQAATYIDSNINTVKNHICYTVIAIDSCLNSTPGDTFCLINLQGKGEQMADSLHWSPFVGYGLGSYVILTLNKSGGWDTLGVVANGDTDYFSTHVQCATSQTYKIAGYAKSGTEITFSNSISLTPFDTVKPPSPQLYYATVLPDQTIKLSWARNPKSIVKYFEIWRKTNHTSPVLIDSVTADSTYIDKSANVKDSIYSYFIIAIDSCNLSNRSKPSQTDIMMHLKLYSLYCSPQVTLKWTPFTGLPNGVSSYGILRSTDGINFNNIGATGPSTTAFVDNLVTIGKQYYYKTEAIDSKSGYVSYSDTLGIIPRLIPLADSAQLVLATVLKSGETNGEIYIQWRRAMRNDTNARGYYVYSFNTSNGKYALLKDITDLNDTSYIQNNINTLHTAYKYYIITYNVCDVGINSNIHKTILLQVQSGNLSSSLKWNNYFGIPVNTYSVYRSKDGGSQNLVFNAGLDSSFSDSAINCNHSYTYQVQAMLANGEISFSDSITVKSFDTIVPKTKPITDVTVLRTDVTDGKIKIEWNTATDNNLEGYNIYRSGNGFNWLLIRQQYPGTSLIDTTLNTYDQSYYYKIQPVDSCGNVGAVSSYQRTVNMKAQSDNGYNQLTWNGYIGWKVKKYLIYKNGVLIDSLANNVFVFKDSSVICNITYQYLIKAIDSANDTIISASNTDSAKALNHTPPQKVYIKTVTVSKPNKAATITWTPSNSYDVKDYLIYRKEAETGNLQFVSSTIQNSYIDSSEAITNPDCYYVFARDHCGNESDASNQGCIIVLSVEASGASLPAQAGTGSGTAAGGYNQLSWNSYKNWYDGVQSYNVYKNEDSAGWQLIGTVSSPLPWRGAGGEAIGEFKDSKLGDSTIDFCYQVEAIENPGQYNQLSRSTVVCVHQDATVFIPNTFTPYDQNLVNDYFAPQGIHIKNYSMKIYNRWGEQVYTTTSGKPWDGTSHGEFVQQGVYIYLINVSDYNGKQSYFKGTITMFE